MVETRRSSSKRAFSPPPSNVKRSKVFIFFLGWGYACLWACFKKFGIFFTSFISKICMCGFEFLMIIIETLGVGVFVVDHRHSESAAGSREGVWV